MEPNVWGPHTWIFLHTITLNYPDNPTKLDKINMMEFFNNLSNILPCEKCALHFKENLKRYPISKSLESREQLVKWLIDIHNEVNKITGKREYSYKEVNDYYLKLYSSGEMDMRLIKKKKNSNIFYILFISLIIIIFYNYYISYING